MSQLVKTEGFVLRVIPFQDEDLILTVLTGDLGKVSVFAKGARRLRSRFGPEIDLLSLSEFVLVDAKNIKPLREVTLKQYFPRLKADYDHLSSALYGARLLSHLVREGQRDLKNLGLFAALLHTLDREDAPVALYELAYKLRLLDNFGVAPHLESCVRCRKPAPTPWFSLERGGVVCQACRLESDGRMKAGLAQGLSALRTMEWAKLERLRLGAQYIVLGSALLDRFMAYHVQDAPLKQRATKGTSSNKRLLQE